MSYVDASTISITAKSSHRRIREKSITGIMLLCSSLAVFTTIGIIASLTFETFAFFQKVPFFDFVFGL